MNLAVKGFHRSDWWCPYGRGGGPIRLAADAGAGRFVVDSGQQVAALSSSAAGTQRLLVDVTAQSADVLAAEVVARPRLDLIGLHCRVGDRHREPIGEIVREMIAQMSWIRHQHAVILTRISLAGAADLCPTVVTCVTSRRSWTKRSTTRAHGSDTRGPRSSCRSRGRRSTRRGNDGRRETRRRDGPSEESVAQVPHVTRSRPTSPSKSNQCPRPGRHLRLRSRRGRG